MLFFYSLLYSFLLLPPFISSTSTAKEAIESMPTWNFLTVEDKNKQIENIKSGTSRSPILITTDKLQKLSMNQPSSNEDFQKLAFGNNVGPNSVDLNEGMIENAKSFASKWAPEELLESVEYELYADLESTDQGERELAKIVQQPRRVQMDNKKEEDHSLDLNSLFETMCKGMMLNAEMKMLELDNAWSKDFAKRTTGRTPQTAPGPKYDEILQDIEKRIKTKRGRQDSSSKSNDLYYAPDHERMMISFHLPTLLKPEADKRGISFYLPLGGHTSNLFDSEKAFTRGQSVQRKGLCTFWKERYRSYSEIIIQFAVPHKISHFLRYYNKRWDALTMSQSDSYL